MTIETPPVENLPADPSVAPAEPPQSLLSSIRVLGRGQDAPQEPAQPPAPVESESQEDSAAETITKDTPPAQEPEPEPPKPAKEEPTNGMSEPAAKKFRALEKHKHQLEQERDTARKELETVRTEHETLKAQARELETIRRDAEKAIEEAKTYREQLRSISIERDPEFQQRYNGQIRTRQQQMLDMAVEAGAVQDEFVRAINSGNEDALETFRDSLTPANQRLWDANRTDIARLLFERREALKNSDRTMEQLETDRAQRTKQDAERVRLENTSLAKKTVETIWAEIPGLDQADVEVRHEIEEWLTNAVVSAPKDQLVKQLAFGQLAQKVVEGQKVEIDRLNGELTERAQKITELEEKLSEQETFIKEVSSHTPRPSLGGKSTGEEKNSSLLSSVRVRLPGH